MVARLPFLQFEFPFLVNRPSTVFLPWYHPKESRQRENSDYNHGIRDSLIGIVRDSIIVLRHRVRNGEHQAK
jgi:hypothetical protein